LGYQAALFGLIWGYRHAARRKTPHRPSHRAAYNYAQHLPERRKMMQAWANYLDGLKKSGKQAA
jgi:hypothetical protein